MSAARRLVAILAIVSAACVGGADTETVLVSAASSLTRAFGAIEVAYEEANPGIDVVLNFAASSTIREQVAGGAPVDVFASASVDDIEAVGDLVGPASVFAVNELAIAVPQGNPAGVSGMADFERDDLFLGVCIDAAPCGALARAAFDAAGVVPSIDSEEPNVRALLTKVAEGELDAGIVYSTDIGAGVEGIAVVGGPIAEYPIAVVLDGPNSSGGADFVTFVLSAEGQSILAEYGFGSP